MNRTNILYGGLDLKTTNVVFVHGSIDPWHVLGITKSPNPQMPVIYIDGVYILIEIFYFSCNTKNLFIIMTIGTAHCANMYPPSKNDPLQLKTARVEVGHLIDEWLHN